MILSDNVRGENFAVTSGLGKLEPGMGITTGEALTSTDLRSNLGV